MASLIQVRDLLALQGRMDAKQLSLSLHTPQPMIDAMTGSDGKSRAHSGRCGWLSLWQLQKLPGRKSLPQGVVGAALIKPGNAARL